MSNKGLAVYRFKSSLGKSRLWWEEEKSGSQTDHNLKNVFLFTRGKIVSLYHASVLLCFGVFTFKQG